MLDGHPAGSALVPALVPSLVTDYRRATLLDAVAGSRLTIDVDLRFYAGHGADTRVRSETVVIETKSAAGPGRVDTVLRRLGVRPVSVSKYCVGIALLHPELPANPWNRLLRRHFGACPAPAGFVRPTMAP